MTRVQSFGRFELLERISAGGMAEVFRARDTSSGEIVALKRILPQIAEDEEFIQMFEDEARIASQLEHPHIARTIDFGHVRESYYIAFEYVNGRDLRALFDRCVRVGQTPPLTFLLYVFARIGEGLAYAHARKDAKGQPVSIVHRDVSPQNIVVSFDGDVKLIDFGIAKAAGKLSRTQVGTLKGKFGYMAPEQIRGMEIDQRADVFSLGICMWELLTLERLFNAENELRVLEKLRNFAIPPPSSKNRDVPPELDRVVLKALAKDLAERYRSAKDLFRDLDKLAQTIGATASREEIARYMRASFPESLARRPTPSELGLPQNGSSNSSNGGRPLSRPANQETSTMAADIPSSDKRGSDLDIFEGLGKKASSAPAKPSSVPPPPPRSMPTNPPMIIKNDVGKKTLVGVAPAVPPQSGQQSRTAPPPGLAPPPISRSAPPPPPGRGSLPQVVPPPPRASVNPPPGAVTTTGLGPSGRTMPPGVSSAAAGAPAGASAKAGLDMDWDDEDEATHVFDKPLGADDGKESRAPRPAAGTPLQPPVKHTLMGLTSPVGSVPPPPPPPSRQSAPPPPPSINAFANGGAVPPAPSFPLPQPEAPTVPNPTQSDAVAPPMPGQINTAPMPMPGAPKTLTSANGFGRLPQPALPPMSAMSAPAMGSRMMEATQLVRPRSSGRTGLIATVAGVAVVAIGLAVIAMPRTGRVAVTVSDAKGAAVNHVEIFVDGKKQCDTSPCMVDQVSAGQHEVKVIAQGYDSAQDKTVTVEARKDAPMDFTLASSSAKAVGTGIKVAGSQPGVKLYIDGKEIGPLPQELHNLTPGDHKIRLAGSDRYAPIERSVILGQDEVQDLGDQTLKVMRGKATIELGTQGAKVSIVSGNDRREFPTLPIAVDLDTSKAWALEASKPGFTDYQQKVNFDDGVAEKTFNITLEPKSAAPAPAPGPAAPA
ncbi:MAG TPA: protein kinase, partial [Polyangiaceae bacterium]